MELNKDQMIDQEALKMRPPFDGPVPGQSLTRNPEGAAPYEQSPEMVDLREASQAIFLSLLEPVMFRQVTKLMIEGTSIEDITKMLLIGGLAKGKFNPDLMVLLIEPVMLMLMAIAEKVGIKNFKMYRGEEEDEAEEPLDPAAEEWVKRQVEKAQRDELNNLNPKKFSDVNVRRISGSPVDQEIMDKLEAIDVTEIRESLMARPERSNNSLMGRE